jgi:hypothetical protein
VAIKITDIWASHSDGVRGNKFNRKESFQIHYWMYVPKEIANNKVQVNHDLCLTKWGDNTAIFHIFGRFTYPPQYGGLNVQHNFNINQNPLGNAPYTNGSESQTGLEWMKFQVAADIEGKDDIAYSSEQFIKFLPFVLK